MVLTTLLTRVSRRIDSQDWVMEYDLDITEYAAGGVSFTPSSFGLQRITGFEVKPREKGYVPLWDGDLAAPTVTVRGQQPTDATAGVVELAEAGAVDVGVFRLVVRGR